MDVPSIMVEEDLTKLREAYRIPEDVELILPEPNERACFPRRGCTALHLNAFVSGMRLPLHPMFRRILRAYDLAPTQVSPNGWSQMVGGMYLWFRHIFGSEMPLHVFQTIYQPRKLPRKKGRDGGGPLPRCELPGEVVDVLKSIYQADQKTRSYGFILNRHRCLVELGLMASKAEMDQGRRPRPTLAKLTKQRPKTLVPGSAEDASQRKVIEGLSRAGNKEVPGASNVIEVDDAPEVEMPLTRKRKTNAGASTGTSAADIAGPYTAGNVPSLQRTLAVNPSGEVVLEGPPKSTPTPEDAAEGPYDSKRRLRELIGAPGSRIPDDHLRSAPFYPAMGAQAVKKYFTSQVGGIFLPWVGGGRAGGELGLGHKGVNPANEGSGRIPDTDAGAEEARRPSFEG
ncbi:Uncharacterized protein Adt_09221 [Abeliophyllum distichum]|uniref:Transposase (putative) gypsy type domain-containing protein n=1 Tax=Abeliophyllum distichum TaxID=126358 RepID=A0ABD1UGV1_9LAMI